MAHLCPAGRGTSSPRSLGGRIRNSEVGHGAVALEFVLHVLMCTNLLISERPFRRLHVGRHAGNGDQPEPGRPVAPVGS